jgi:hypothetical protein
MREQAVDLVLGCCKPGLVIVFRMDGGAIGEAREVRRTTRLGPHGWGARSASPSACPNAACGFPLRRRGGTDLMDARAVRGGKTHLSWRAWFPDRMAGDGGVVKVKAQAGRGRRMIRESRRRRRRTPFPGKRNRRPNGSGAPPTRSRLGLTPEGYSSINGHRNFTVPCAPTQGWRGTERIAPIKTVPRESNVRGGQ